MAFKAIYPAKRSSDKGSRSRCRRQHSNRGSRRRCRDRSRNGSRSN